MTQHQEPPVNITTARTGHSDDMHRRQRRYLMSMAIRTVCFILAIVTQGWLRWALVTGAIILPYVAVILANATDRRSSASPPSFAVHDLTGIESGSSPATPAPQPAPDPPPARQETSTPPPDGSG